MKAAIVVFAREPLQGRVKTRLAAEVGEGAAARVYAALLDQTLLVAADPDFDVTVSLAEEPSASWTEQCARTWEVQCGGDLGARMRDAFDRRFREGYERVLVVGSDCARLRVEHLREASDALDDAPVALGPSPDGGYWLIAQRRPGVDLFTGIPWSDPATLAATRDRLRHLRSCWVELEQLDDIDTAEDLETALADPLVTPELRDRLLDALSV